ncbi:T9SS type A sorting domain-containing protein [Rubrivirga sp.]|uniref:T9SS type A sorting domain-containing protein n=1 Tax=Rubrivirga sp. TaxID=1885344 RepID=UPI003C709ED3
MPSSDTLKNSLWYAAAATAAATLGVSEADAQVVYVDVSPDATLTDAAFDIDIDGDGDPEFSIAESTHDRNQIILLTDPESGDHVDGVVGNGFIYRGNSYGYALPVTGGAEISGANANMVDLDDYTLPVQASFTFEGSDPNDWLSSGASFVGLRFRLDNGDQHFGWVRVEAQDEGQVRVLDYGFNATPGAAIAAGAGGPVSIDPDELAAGYTFTPIAPNPVSSVSRFDLEVAETESVTVEMFDALGRNVRTLHDGPLVGGSGVTLEVERAGLSTGLYVVRVTGESFVTSRSMTVVR